MANELKFDGGVPSEREMFVNVLMNSIQTQIIVFWYSPGKLNAPPNSCIPSRAKMRMNKKRRKSNEMMDLIELKSEITKFLREDQYFVTLNILNNLNALKTDRPNDPARATMLVQQTSNTLAKMTMQSNRLKEDSK